MNKSQGATELRLDRNSYIRYNISLFVGSRIPSLVCERILRSFVDQAGRYPTTMAEKTAEIFIQGVTLDGRQFRPSDWAERLCGVMTCFRPGNTRDAHLYYSAYVRPIVIDKMKCVVVNTKLEEIEPAAYKFLLNFAKD